MLSGVIVHNTMIYPSTRPCVTVESIALGLWARWKYSSKLIGSATPAPTYLIILIDHIFASSYVDVSASRYLDTSTHRHVYTSEFMGGVVSEYLRQLSDLRNQGTISSSSTQNQVKSAYLFRQSKPLNKDAEHQEEYMGRYFKRPLEPCRVYLITAQTKKVFFDFELSNT